MDIFHSTILSIFNTVSKLRYSNHVLDTNVTKILSNIAFSLVLYYFWWGNWNFHYENYERIPNWAHLHSVLLEAFMMSYWQWENVTGQFDTEQKCHNKDVWQEQFPAHESVHVSSVAQNIVTPKKNKMPQQRCLAGTVPNQWKCTCIVWKPATLLRACAGYVIFWGVGDNWESPILCIKALSILFHFHTCNQLNIQKAISSNLTRQGFD